MPYGKWCFMFPLPTPKEQEAWDTLLCLVERLAYKPTFAYRISNTLDNSTRVEKLFEGVFASETIFAKVYISHPSELNLYVYMENRT